MELLGMVHNGVIVLDNAPELPEGTRVRVTLEPTEADCQSLRNLLLQYAGTAPGLPSDLAEQHDHYIHGTPKR